MTLFGIVREMLASGQLTTKPTYHEQMGSGEKLVYEGEPVQIFTNVREIAGQVWREPHDVMLTHDGVLITSARSREVEI